MRSGWCHRPWSAPPPASTDSGLPSVQGGLCVNGLGVVSGGAGSPVQRVQGPCRQSSESRKPTTLLPL
ncbi:hypothetical protein GS534_06770 [Rhodococcus hoagii]|nr:hypothetical protein [Prescottella equi]